MTIANSSFTLMGLSADLQATLERLGYKKPTEIQVQSIPAAIAGHDLIAIAPTGTGKTAAFALPILQRLASMNKLRESKMPTALVLTPTRELAIQVLADFENYGFGLGLEYLLLHGGVSYDAQIQKIDAGIDVVVSTPGRLRDHLESRRIDLSKIEVLVLDEADRMLDMGFIDDVSEIIGYTNNLRQTLMFSATFSDEVRALAKEYLRAPKSISPTLSPAATPKIVHVIHPVDPAQKIGAFLFILDQYPNQQILVFTRTKARADELAKRVTNHNIKSMATHSDRTQAYRTKAMACFRDGRIRVLVATDIAARGIDIDDLPLVVNYELPNLPEDYVHRIGRTGRAGAEGKAISLLTQGELCLLAPIEKLLKKQIPQIWLEGFFPKKFDPRASVKPEIRTRVRKSKWTK